MLTLESYFIEKGFEIGKMEGKMEGFTEGERIKAIQTAKKMLKKGFDINEISDITGLSIEEILELKGEKLN